MHRSTSLSLPITVSRRCYATVDIKFMRGNFYLYYDGDIEKNRASQDTIINTDGKLNLYMQKMVNIATCGIYY